jgi:hypothetical protein
LGDAIQPEEEKNDQDDEGGEQEEEDIEADYSKGSADIPSDENKGDQGRHNIKIDPIIFIVFIFM